MTIIRNKTYSGRLDALRSGIEKSHKGLEIAPYFNPLVPKSEGYNVQILDIFSWKELQRRANEDPLIPAETYEKIEDVDYVGSATELAKLVPQDAHESFDYIVSSHNFEHLPNPVKFLQGCERVLKPGGHLVMAVPDARMSFDLFRPNTTLADWLEAYAEDRERPNARQVFDSWSLIAMVKPEDRDALPFTPAFLPSQAMVESDIAALWEGWSESETGDYVDAHCTVMTPAVLEHLIYETRCLGLTGLTVVEVSQLPGQAEFLIRLQKNKARESAPDRASQLAQRSVLLQRIINEEDKETGSPSRKPSRAKALIMNLIGPETYQRLRERNRARRRARH
jgi:SAM-dependent methyltransferase